MNLAGLVGLVLPLALDTFAVSAAVGLAGAGRGQRLRLGLVFAAFEGGAPAIGLLAGGPLGRALGGGADYLAIALLLGLGVFGLLRPEEDVPVGRLRDTHGLALLLLGLSVSLDELAVGFTLGLLRLPVLPCLLVIGAQAFLVSQLGLAVGNRLSGQVREGAERAAAIALVAIGGALLVSRLA